MFRKAEWIRVLSLILGLAVATGDGWAAPPGPTGKSDLIPAASISPTGDGPWVVRAYFRDRQSVSDLAAEIEPWEVDYDAGFLVVGVDAAGYALLLRLGFSVEIDTELTAKLTAPRPILPEGATGIPGFACYRTVEETFAAAAALVTLRPDLASWIDIGDSWEKTVDPSSGYDLWVLRLTNSAIPGPKPKLFVMSSMHAREYTPAELTTRFGELLVDSYDRDADASWLLDYHEIHLLLQANPDGRKWAEQGLWWRKNTNNDYCSNTEDRGADLNRNFEFLWGCCGGSSGFECSETYRGPSPASEPETQAIQDYVRSQFPDQRGDDPDDPAPADATGVFLDIHSYSELMLWPWGYTWDPPPNGTALQTLGRKLAFFNGYFPEQAIGLYPTDGTTDDFAYGELGLAAYTFELGTSFFQDCQSFEEVILPDNLAALTYAAKVVRTPYLTPAGPEALNVTATPLVAMPAEPVMVAAVLDDSRYETSNGAEPVQPVMAGHATLNDPPWTPTTPYPLNAVDGSFDGPVEAVQATLDTSVLPEGRHRVFVWGEDALGNEGAVGAAIFWILDPATAPIIEGYVLESLTDLPLAAHVTTGEFSADTDPASGYYSLMVPPGTYTLTASAEGHAAVSQTGVEAIASQVTRVDFRLDRICSLFADDVESGNLGWTVDPPWAITSESANSPSHSWTDSPGGNYANFADISITSPAFDLTGVSGVSIAFWHTYDLETSYDYGHVEVSADGGATWTTVSSFNGWGHTTWTAEEIAVPELDGAAEARIRFRLDTDVSITGDGWHLDDITVVGGSAGCSLPASIFSDDFESGDTSAWSESLP